MPTSISTISTLPTLSDSLVPLEQTEQPSIELTELELETLRQICLPRKIACQNLGINHGALQTRYDRIRAKFGVENNRALVVKLLHLGLVTINFFLYRNFEAEL